jgi:hypothetical protein
MLVGSAFCVAGAVICQMWAPETAGRRLVETASAEGDRRAGPAAEAAT